MKLFTLLFIFLSPYVLSMLGDEDTSTIDKSMDDKFPELKEFFNHECLRNSLNAVEFKDIKDWTCDELRSTFPDFTPTIETQFNHFVQELKDKSTISNPTQACPTQVCESGQPQLQVSDGRKPFEKTLTGEPSNPFRGDYTSLAPNPYDKPQTQPFASLQYQPQTPEKDELESRQAELFNITATNDLKGEINKIAGYTVSLQELQHILIHFNSSLHNSNRITCEEIQGSINNKDKFRVQLYKKTLSSSTIDGIDGIEARRINHRNAIAPLIKEEAGIPIITTIMMALGGAPWQVIENLNKELLID